MRFAHDMSSGHDMHNKLRVRAGYPHTYYLKYFYRTLRQLICNE